MNSVAESSQSNPIIEAVVDIDCVMPVGFEMHSVETRATDLLGDSYPLVQKRMLLHSRLEAAEGAASLRKVGDGLAALQFLKEDKKQLVQFRAAGFSFNRLAPYVSLDDLLPEIEQAWSIYTDIAQPIEVGEIRLRYINRLELPLSKGEVDLDRFLTLGPKVYNETSASLTDFLVRTIAIEKDGRSKVTTTIASEPPIRDFVPVLLDIQVAQQGRDLDWSTLVSQILELRHLKNEVFRANWKAHV